MSYSAPANLAGITFGLAGTLTWDASGLAGSAPVLLLHFDGMNGDTTTTDSSPQNNAMTILPVASISNAETSPVGDTTVLFTDTSYGGSLCYTPIGGTGSPLEMSNVTDWTVEFFAWDTRHAFESTTLFAMGWATDGSAGFNGVRIEAPGSNQCVVTIYGAASGPNSPWISSGFTPSAWHHIAFVKQGGAGLSGSDRYQLFVDGVGTGWQDGWYGPYTVWQGYDVVSGYYSGPGGYSAFIGGESAYYSEVRILNGVAAYTANFTPPTAPFSANGIPPPGYDVYRNGVSIATFLGTPGYIDTVPTPGSYVYQVFAWDGTSDVSAGSNFLDLVYGSSTTIDVYGKFAPAATVLPPILMVDAAGIGPKVYMPKENVTVNT